MWENGHSRAFLCIVMPTVICVPNGEMVMQIYGHVVFVVGVMRATWRDYIMGIFGKHIHVIHVHSTNVWTTPELNKCDIETVMCYLGNIIYTGHPLFERSHARQKCSVLAGCWAHNSRVKRHNNAFMLENPFLAKHHPQILIYSIHIPHNKSKHLKSPYR